jgi:hypothetical protein
VGAWEVTVTSAAQKTFERFHARPAKKAVFPFNAAKDGSFLLPKFVQFPAKVRKVGNAVRVLYESDKWNSVGKTVEYYHDHGKGVMFYEPAEDGSETFPHRYPDEICLIGECIGLVVAPFGEEIAEGIMQGSNILVASPDGWIDKMRHNRVFLAIINLDGGGVEGLIDGGNLRITSHGIEG